MLGPLALGTAIFAVIHGETSGYADPTVAALFGLSVVVALLFVLVEWRSRSPIFNFVFLRRAPFA